MVAGSLDGLASSNQQEVDRSAVRRSITTWCFHLFGKQFLQFLDTVPPGEIDKAFAAMALGEKDFKHVLEQGGQLVKCDTSKNLTRDRLFFSETAAENHVVTFDRITTLIHLGSKQADVAHVMLGA